jgi:hypothetical protein
MEVRMQSAGETDAQQKLLALAYHAEFASQVCQSIWSRGIAIALSSDQQTRALTIGRWQANQTRIHPVYNSAPDVVCPAACSPSGRAWL